MIGHCRALLCVVGLSGILFLFGAFSISAETPVPPSLVTVTYMDWEGLQKLRPLGLNVLDLQDEILAAVVSPREIADLRSLGFAVSVMDTPAAPDLYYLVAPPPSGSTSSLYSSGQVFPYTKESYILKAQLAQVEMLAGEGYFVKKLFGPVALPAAPPYTAVMPPHIAVQPANPLLQTLVNSVSNSALNDTIAYLQDNASLSGWDARGSRYYNSSQLPGKRDYIKSRMQNLGLPVSLSDCTTYGTSPCNIEGTLAGWGPGSDTIYIVGAHYDSISNDPYNVAPGADDNASGIAGVLETARVLSTYRFKKTLRFLGFAAEEPGIFGSQHYAQSARSVGTKINGMIDLDMIAWDSNSDNQMDIHAGTRYDSQSLGAAILNANSAYTIGLQPQYITSGSSRFSDHSRFWDQGYPAVMLIEDYYASSSGVKDFNSYYHTTSDTLGRLRLPYAKKFVQATVATLADLAEIIPPGLRLEHSGPGLVLTSTQAALTINYSVPGPDAVSNATLTDTLAEGLTFAADNSGFTRSQPDAKTIVWQLGNLAPYTRASFTVTVSVSATLQPRQTVTSAVEGTGTVVWDDPNDNRASWSATVGSARLYLPTITEQSAQ